MDHLHDAVFDVEDSEYEPSDNMSQSVPSTSQDHLERCGRWLVSIPRQDVASLQQTQEYHDFIAAFERLANVHRSDVARSRSFMTLEEAEAEAEAVPVPRDPLGQPMAPSEVHGRDFSFLQHMADDDTVLRAFEFLECRSLVRISMTCSRFRELAHRSAAQRTYDVAQARQLNNVMKLLRAKEQIDGIGTDIRDPHVRVPVLLLGRRVIVTNAGDPEYNGIYFCTGSNGNGFIFTKPRFPERRILRAQGTIRMRENIANADHRGRLESEVAHPGQLLRCIIAKRFSNETILWYISKEVLSTENAEGVRAGAVTQTFSYWSKLMVVGDASPDICRYPSQTSILARHNEGWQTLTTTRATRPPIVELLD
ncbi:expressed unknown protein [Seminavis robusta]|uniref:F-box domain-containing protein n=1 Tax=Seminavis robusta TaxID=568900 RepID=A0A9N8HQH1_9STRA|nr:expressed unknown protein [Seminavis robusta]|eukprot:Sro1442_g273030.1 n/a (367) ;mRNA; f:6964-8159